MSSAVLDRDGLEVAKLLSLDAKEQLESIASNLGRIAARLDVAQCHVESVRDFCDRSRRDIESALRAISVLESRLPGANPGYAASD
jgi:hypothetical protein